MDRKSSSRLSRWVPVPFLWVLLLGIALAPAAWGAGKASVQEEATDRVLIKFRNPSAAPRIASVQQAAPRDRVQALAVRRATPMQYLRTMYNGTHTVRLGRFYQGAELKAIIARLATDPEVEAVGPDHIARAQAVPNDPRYGDNNGDPNGQFTQQWYLLAPNSTLISPIDAVGAWDYSRGSAGVPVAVIDTGVLFRHPDLGTVANGGKLLPGYDMVGPDGNSSPPTYYIANDGNGADPDPTDPGDWINTADTSNSVFKAVTGGCPIQPSSWHGTKVAGVIGASTNDGIGIAGVGWNTPVLPVRALGKCIGYESDIIDAMAWAAGIDINNTSTYFPDTTSSYYPFPVNPHPAKVLNMSLGSTASTCDSFYTDIITTLTAMNVVIVAAAGNGDATDNSGAGGAVRMPANCPGVIGVAALRFAGTKVGFSDLGPEVAISAPGGNCVNSAPPCLYSIVSTGNSATESATDGGMNYIDGNQADFTYSGQSFSGGGEFGTSFSAPMVSGVVALMLTINPNLTPAQVLDLLQNSARSFPTQPNGSTVPVCPAPPTVVAGSGECYCPPPTVAATSTSPASGGLCGAGMLDARQAVLAAWTAGGNAGTPPLLPDPTTTTVSPPVIPPPPVNTGGGTTSGGGGGGGGSASLWWILAIVAASVMRARTVPLARSGAPLQRS